MIPSHIRILQTMEMGPGTDMAIRCQNWFFYLLCLTYVALHRYSLLTVPLPSIHVGTLANIAALQRV